MIAAAAPTIDDADATIHSLKIATIVCEIGAVPLQGPPGRTRVGSPYNPGGNYRRYLTDLFKEKQVPIDKISKSNKEKSSFKVELEEEEVARREVEMKLAEASNETKRLLLDTEALRDKISDITSIVKVKEL